MQHHTHHQNLVYDCDRIHSVTNFPQGNILVSKSRNYYAVLQSDGNFVVYVSGHFVPKNAIWNSGTYGKGHAPYHLRNQDDGNLVVYDGNLQPTWASNTSGKGEGPWSLIMQDDGNLVLYDKHGKPTWATGSNR